jgi:phosphatidylglycerol:prolipoprotein diacylglycerol transferase
MDPSVLWSAAILLGLRQAMRDAAGCGLDGRKMYITGVCAVLAALTGSRLLDILLNAEPLTAPSLFAGSRAWFGAIAGGAIVFAIAGRDYAKSSAAGVALGYAVGRIGCFLNGCEPGAESPFGWTHPHQLYASFSGLLLFLCLRRLPAAHRLTVFCAGYGVSRFALEFFRRDYKPLAAGLTPAQILSLGLIGYGITLWRFERRGCAA